MWMFLAGVYVAIAVMMFLLVSFLVVLRQD